MILKIKTERLILRPWKEEDLEPFFQMNSDPRVMEYFPSILSKEESDQLARGMQKKIEVGECGFWAVSVPNIAEFIGFIGLNSLILPIHLTPAVEIGWRLAFDHWGKGYATEGALACLKYGFKALKLNEIISYTVEKNAPSRAVMEKIGMHRNPADDFNLPPSPEGHSLRHAVLYRLSRNEWREMQP